MTRLVVDASVVVKWFVPEIHSESALRLLKRRSERDEITDENALFILQQLGRFNLAVHSSQELADTAWALASRLKRTFYDSLYLALSESQGCPLVTADRRLFNAVSPAGLKLVWIEDIV